MNNYHFQNHFSKDKTKIPETHFNLAINVIISLTINYTYLLYIEYNV